MRRLIAAVAAGLCPAVMQAQSPPDSVPVIRAVETYRHNIFDPSEATSFLPRLANSLHMTTRQGVIRRELLFRPGQPYDSLAVAETARNLRSLGIFRRVDVDSVRADSGLVVRVVTADGWSTRPNFSFGITESSLRYTLSIEERNFLGTATLVGLRYRKDPDRSITAASFRQTRLFAGRVGLAAQYLDRSDGGGGVFASFSKPFFSLATRSSWRIDGEERRERVLRFFDGSNEAGEILQHRFALGYAAAAWALRASPAGYFRLGVSSQLRRQDYTIESADTLSTTITGAVGTFVQWRKARFLVSKGLEGFGRVEDVDVSTVVQAGVSATPKLFGYEDDGIASHLVARAGFGQPTHFVQFFFTGVGRFTSAGLDSGSVHLAATAYLLPGPRSLATLHASSGWQKRSAPGAEFDLGFGVGPRAFREHSFTGNRAFFTTAEYRYTLAEDFLKLTAIGVAAFADYGGAWYRGSPRRTGWDAGVGLRFGFTRSTDIESNRIDFAYRGANDFYPKGEWTLVIAKGFAFSTSGRLDQ